MDFTIARVHDAQIALAVHDLAGEGERTQICRGSGNLARVDSDDERVFDQLNHRLIIAIDKCPAQTDCSSFVRLDLAVGTVFTGTYQEIALSFVIHGTRTGRNQSRKRTGFDNPLKCSLLSVFKNGRGKCLLGACKRNSGNGAQDEDHGDQGLDLPCDSRGGFWQITNIEFAHSCTSEPGTCEGSILVPGGYGVGLIHTRPLAILV